MIKLNKKKWKNRKIATHKAFNPKIFLFSIMMVPLYFIT